MSRFCLFLAGLLFSAVLAGRIGDYFGGQAFDQSWLLLPVGVAMLALLLVGGLIALVAAFLTLIAWRRPSRSRLVIILAVPLAFITGHLIPLPSFVDGMSVALREKTTPERLRQFAAAARDLPMAPAATAGSPELPDAWAGLMQRDFPDLYKLSPLRPRVAVVRDASHIFWGGALVHHWGVRIEFTPAAAADRDQLQSEVWTDYREAHPGIWVYQERH